MKRWITPLSLFVLVGCGSATQPPLPFPADLTRYHQFEDPVVARRFAFADSAGITPAVMQEIDRELRRQGWSFDPTNPNAIIAVDWGTEKPILAPRLRRRTQYSPYSFTSNGIRYQLYQGYSVIDTVDTLVCPVWMTLTIRDPAASPHEVPLFDGRIRSGFEAPCLTETLLPILIKPFFVSFPGQDGHKQTLQIPLSPSLP